MEPGSPERCRPRGYQHVQQRRPRLPAERRILWPERIVNGCTCLPPAQPEAASRRAIRAARHAPNGRGGGQCLPRVSDLLDVYASLGYRQHDVPIGISGTS